MNNTILVATNNMGKAQEFREMFAPRGYDIKTLADFPEIDEIEETGTTFEENALLKANTLYDLTGKIVLADDSGLTVDALNGEPGIYSARYSGGDHDDVANYTKLLRKLDGVAEAERTAQFHSVLALVGPDKEPLLVHGEIAGYILEEAVGHNGFGYDPVFYIKELGKTMAEMSLAEKNKISHRAKALQKLDKRFDDWMDER